MNDIDKPRSGTVLPARTAAIRVSLALVAATPAVVVRVTGLSLTPAVAVIVFGVAVLASVALLMWAAEAVRADISGSLALALLSIVAILPEYAVDIFFAYRAGSDPAYAAYATANMTGANRLLIGVAWPILTFVAIWAIRRRSGGSEYKGCFRTGIRLDKQRRIELWFLGAATLYALVLPLTGRIAWYDTLILGALFAGYLWRIRGNTDSDEELTGVAATVAAQPRLRRRLLVAGLFVAAAIVILSAAEPFGQALVEAGSQLGVDRFLLVQWLAPIASESPEVLVAITFALRNRANDGMTALLAAKLNQWTLLIACLPLAYYLGGGGAAGLPLDARQTEELVLTTAQTVLGVAILTNLQLTGGKALLLLVLFTAQFVLPDEHARYAMSIIYVLVAAVFLLVHHRDLPLLVQAGVRREPDARSNSRKG